MASSSGKGTMEDIRDASPSQTAPCPSRPPAGAPKPLDRVRQAIRAKHYSRRTEAVYVEWIRRFIL
jgi:hypothetical protein